MAAVKSRVVSDRALAEVAGRLQLGASLRLAHGEERSGGREKISVVAAALEAVIGAVYLDAGFEAARTLIEPWVEQGAAVRNAQDAKSRLQEVLQARGLDTPVYRHTDREGPDHDPTFHVECIIEAEVAARAAGHSKRVAEQRAAGEALSVLEESGANG